MGRVLQFSFIPTLTFEEDRRQISSSLNIKDGELQQAFRKQHARRRLEEEKPSQQECQEDVLHEDCQDACEDAEVKEVHHLGELEEEGQGGGDRQEHQEEPR